MKTSPLITVIIPLYNKEQWVKRALDSVLAQTYENFEILVVNDGSTDKSREVVAAYDDERIHIIDKQNGGVSSARNLGIKRAKGEYLALLDADDEWKPEHLSVLMEGFRRFPDAVIVCDDLEEVRNSEVKKRVLPFQTDGNDVKNARYFVIEDYLATLRDDFFILSASSVLIRSSIVKMHDVLFYEDMKHGEDVNYWIRLSRYGEFVFSDYPGAVYHHVDAQSAMNRKVETVQWTPDYFRGLAWSSFDDVERKNIVIFLTREYYKKAFQNRGVSSSRGEFLGKIGEVQLGYFPRFVYLCIRYCPDRIFAFLKQIKKYKENRYV